MRKPVYQLMPVSPTNDIRCGVRDCPELARWVEVCRPIVDGVQQGPFLYRYCDGHKPRAVQG